MGSALFEAYQLQRITGNSLRPGGLELTEHAFSICRFAQNSRLIDLGCGLGATVRHLGAVPLWEDHSHHLIQLAADLIFGHGSLERFWKTAGGGYATLRGPQNPRGSKPGYFLMVAEKKECADG